MSSINDQLNVTTIISPVTCNIGDIVTYMVQITVPEGVVAYNIQTTVVYPTNDQKIILGSFMRDNINLNVQPTIENNQIKFSPISQIDASDEEINTVYTFQAKVIDAKLPKETVINFEYQYVDVQESQVVVKWSNNLNIVENDVSNSTGILNVCLPYIVIDYKHADTMQNGELTRNALNFNIGDVIKYEIIVSNNGLASANNIIVTDLVENVLKIDHKSFVVTSGKFQVANSNKIIWNLPSLQPKQQEILNFTVEVLPVVSMSQVILGYVTGTYVKSAVKTEKFSSNTLVSNSEGANFTVTSTSNQYILGSNIGYILTIIIPPNVYVKNLKVYDLLPPNQQYVDKTLTQQINTESVINLTPSLETQDNTNQQIIVIPQVTKWGKPGSVNTTVSNTIVYKFQAELINQVQTYPYIQQVTNLGYISWSVGEGSNLQTYGDEENCTITINQPNLVLFKEQQLQTNINNQYIQSEILTDIGDAINYKLRVSNNGTSTAYNIVVTSKLQPCFLFQSTVSSPTLGNVSVPTVGSNGTITWNVGNLEPSKSAEYIYSVTISKLVKLKEIFLDTSVAKYNTLSNGGIQLSETSNQLLLIIKGVGLNYTPSKSIVVFNDIIKYSIIITIPKGITIYNMKILCMLSYMETYNNASWTTSLNNLKGTSNPKQLSDNMLEYIEPTIELQATNEPLVVTYTYTTTVTNLPEAISPYYIIASNLCNVYWDNDLNSNDLKFTLGHIDIQVNQPNLICEKAQRNKTQGQTSFTKDVITNVNPGDIIEYQLSITNNGKATGYAVAIIDNLSLTYVSSTAPNPTLQSSTEFTSFGGNLSPNNSVTYILTCQVPKDYVKGTSKVNNFDVSYNPSLEENHFLIGGPSNNVAIENNIPSMNSYFLNLEVTPSGSVIYAQGQTETMIVGVKIPYYVDVTIPQGTTLYDIQVNCNLSSGQVYVDSTFSGDGTLISSTNNSLTISLGKVVTGPKNFKFSYDIEATEATSSKEQIIQNPLFQYNTLNWNIHEGGPSASGVTANSYAYSTSLKPQIVLKHGFNSSSVSENMLELSNVGQEIFYELSVINNTAYPMYDISIYDNFQDSILVQGIESVVPSGAFILTQPLGSFQFYGNIPVINKNSTVTITFITKLVGPVVPGTSLTNEISTYYGTEQQTNGILYGLIKSNKVECYIPTSLIKLNLIPVPELVEVGGQLKYNLQVFIPQGMKMYNCSLLDSLPLGQMYLQDISPKSFSSTSTTGEVVLITKSLINTENGGQILDYTYGVQINEVLDIGSQSLEPVEETNEVILQWAQSPNSPSIIDVNTTCTVMVSKPALKLTCEQQIVGTDKVFYESKAGVNVGDNLNFRLNLINFGSGTAYDVVVTCNLSQFIKYVDEISVKNGTITLDSSSNQVLWSIPQVSSTQSITAIFTVQVRNGAAAGVILENTFNETDRTSNLNSALTDSNNGNSLKEQLPNIQVIKSGNLTNAVIGSKINYNLLVKIPIGVVCYNLKVRDVLPVGQEYDEAELPTLNGRSTNVIVNGQEVTFNSISNSIPSESVETYSYSFTARVNGVGDIPNGNIQNNLAYIQWDLDNKASNAAVPQENNLNINVYNNMINITKQQRIVGNKDIFTESVLYASVGDDIQYQLVVTNNSKDNTGNIVITDTIDSRLKFISIVSITEGSLDQTLLKEGIIKWNYNSTLVPQQSIKLIYEVEIQSFNGSAIINEAIESFQSNRLASAVNNVYSNKVKLRDLKTQFNFEPSRVNYIDFNQAQSYGVLGCRGKITYVYTNTSVIAQNVSLQISELPFNYSILINGVFVKEVYNNTSFNSSLNELNNILPGGRVYISLIYNVPKVYKITQNPITFTVSITTSTISYYVSTINNYIYLGSISMNSTYTSSNYKLNPNMYSVNYNVQINISKGIKIYDLQLETNYSSSYIFDSATQNGSSVNITVAEGKLIYPVITEVNALKDSLQINYGYTLLQYKNTPIGVGELEQSLALLSIRTSPNIDMKCTLQQYIGDQNTGEQISCIYIDNVEGECVQYFKYTDISIPNVEGFEVKNILFSNPIIKDKTIISSNCDNNFIEVSYKFTIPYTIEYENQGCNSIEATIREGILASQDVKVMVFTPEYINESIQIVSETIIKKLCINNNNSFTACLGIVTYSVGKKSMLVKETKGAKILHCCSICNK